jgi:hypothetical protein
LIYFGCPFLALVLSNKNPGAFAPGLKVRKRGLLALPAILFGGALQRKSPAYAYGISTI